VQKQASPYLSVNNPYKLKLRVKPQLFLFLNKLLKSNSIYGIIYVAIIVAKKITKRKVVVSMKKKLGKKVVSLFVSFVLILFTVVNSNVYFYANADTTETILVSEDDDCIVYDVVTGINDIVSRAVHTLSCWYSDGTSIAYWRSTPTIYLCYLDGNSSFNSAMNTAANRWGSALGKSYSCENTTSTSARSNAIIFYGGEYTTLKNRAGFTDADLTGTNQLPVAGVALVYRGSDGNSYQTNAGLTINGGYITRVSGAILDNGSNSASSSYLHTCIHELGHALGWLDHSANPSDIMYELNTTTTTLTSRDINHLKQIYNIMG